MHKQKNILRVGILLVAWLRFSSIRLLALCIVFRGGASVGLRSRQILTFSADALQGREEMDGNKTHDLGEYFWPREGLAGNDLWLIMLVWLFGGFATNHQLTLVGLC